MNCELFAKMNQVFSKENKTLKKYWKIGKNTGKVREKSGNFVSPEKWEPWSWQWWYSVYSFKFRKVNLNENVVCETARHPARGVLQGVVSNWDWCVDLVPGCLLIVKCKVGTAPGENLTGSCDQWSSLASKLAVDVTWSPKAGTSLNHKS